jgi:serine/threonine-protein kinase
VTPEPGQTLAHYRLVEKIGEGGMGVVWKAVDTTLDREVAIKILPEDFARDTERLGRFQREAKILASLNHPNIAAVYGFHEESGVRFLAMEMAAGEDLAERIEGGPVAVDEALAIAGQIASALETAHESGVIHRDLKPANVRVTPEGKVKVLDFGLAKGFEVASGSGDPSLSPTLTSTGTAAGVILGTAAYMSPEQARGRVVDKRTDIWAFGVVLFEMLAGQPLFKGETISDSIASVLKTDPEWTRLPPETPAGVRRVLRRCLAKDPAMRLRDIGDARIELGERGEEPGAPGPAAALADHATAPRRNPALLWGFAGILAGAVLGALVWRALGFGVGIAPPSPLTRLSILVPEEAPISTRVSRPVAISPDGRRVIYVGTEDGSHRLFLRDLGKTDPEPIPGTENGLDPFFSPDGGSIGFIDQERYSLMRTTLGSMAPSVLREEPTLVGATWGEDGYVYYVPYSSEGSGQWGIQRIPSGGGEPEVITTIAEGGGEMHVWPELLPGGHGLIFSSVSDFNFEQSRVRVRNLETNEERTLVENGVYARYIRGGHLVYLQGKTLLAARFDLDRLELTGPPAPVLSGVLTNPDSGSVGFSISLNGTLAYVPDTGAAGRSAVWRVSPSGDLERMEFETGDWLNLRVSPSGDRVAASLQSGPGQYDIWVQDLRRGTLDRLTDDSNSSWPAWSSDGRSLFITVIEDTQTSHVARVPTDGTAPSTVLLTSSLFPSVTDASPDGRFVVIQEQEAAVKGNSDLYLLPLEEGAERRPLVVSDAAETWGRISPDGRYLAYASDQLGRSEVFVRTFPEGKEAWRISSGGGASPVWSRDGRSLSYLNGNEIKTVPVTLSPEFSAGEPRSVVTLEGAPLNISIGLNTASPDALPDGSLILIRPESGAGGPTRIDVVLNWFEQFRESSPRAAPPQR